MFNLVMIGPPGAGKGTQAEQLVSDFKLLHISTGDLLRQAINEGSPLGRQAKAAVDAGVLVPDEVVIGLVDEKISGNGAGRGFILDGFPRTPAQASSLEILLGRRDLPLDHVIVFDIPTKMLEKRISQRAEQSRAGGRPARSDDNPEVLKRRILEFTQATEALSPFYEERNLLRRIDASKQVDEVASQIRSFLRP